MMAKSKEIVIDPAAVMQYLSVLKFESVEQVKTQTVETEVDPLDECNEGYLGNPSLPTRVKHEQTKKEVECEETADIRPGDLYINPTESNEPIRGQHVIRTLPVLGNGVPGIAGRRFPFALTLIARSTQRDLWGKGKQQGQHLCWSKDTKVPSAIPPQKLPDGTCMTCPHRKPEDDSIPKCDWGVRNHAIIWATAVNEDGSAKKDKDRFIIQPIFAEIFLSKTKLGIHMDYWSKMTSKKTIYSRTFLAQINREENKATGNHWYAFQHKGVIETPQNLQELCIKVREELLRPYLAELKAKESLKKATESFGYGANTVEAANTSDTEDYTEAMDAPPF